jgi:hypothetical protein
VKIIKMIVPDTMIHVDKNHNENVNVDTRTIELALTLNDYHANYFFPENSIQVISVEEYKD